MSSSPVTASTATSDAVDTVDRPTVSEHETDHTIQHARWPARRADEALWPDRVANPRRTKVR